MKLFSWNNKKDKKHSVLQIVLTGRFIKDAYNKRASEIESLRKYDRGEKKISPVDLKELVRGL